MGNTTMQSDNSNGRHNNGKGQHGDMWHDDGNRRQQGYERHEDTTKRGRWAT